MPKPTICKHCSAVNQHFSFQCASQRKPIKSKSSRGENSSTKEQKAALNVFFASQSLVIPKRCENCLKPLILNNHWNRRKVSCHILPKSPNSGFPSVSLDPQNMIFMCCDSGCYGHSKWDNGDANDRIKMPVYKIAIERFRNFENELTPKEQVKAYKYLNL